LCRDFPELIPELEHRLEAVRQLQHMVVPSDADSVTSPGRVPPASKPNALPNTAPFASPNAASPNAASPNAASPKAAPPSAPKNDHPVDQPADKPAAGAFATRVDTVASFGRFRVQKLLGEGGFAKVYLAYDPELDRQVALKVPHVSFDRLDLLRREARIAARLRHPAIVQIHEICSPSLAGPRAAPTSAEPPMYVVMQYIEGTNLARKLEATKLTPDQAVDLMLDVVEAIAYAHSQGVLHRDLKPHNILLDVNGRPYVADFGLAVRQETLANHVGEGYGTPAYMSPEQASGQSLTPASDIWSLGVMLYELLVRQRPFGSDPVEVLRRLAREEPVRPTEVDTSVPQDLERICLRCLARNPADRYESAQALIAELRRWKTYRAAGPSEVDLERAERYSRQAVTHMEAGDLPSAIDRLQHAVQLNPDLASAYYQLGLCYLLSDQEVQLAVLALKKATELNRDNGPANYLLANVYVELNALNQAAHHADQAVAIRPADQTYRDCQRQIRHKLGRLAASDTASAVDLTQSLEPARRRRLAEVADAVLHLAASRQLRLRHWTELHYPWRALAQHPLAGSIIMTIALYALSIAAQLAAWDDRRAIQYTVAYVVVWLGLYIPFVLARMLERAYDRLVPVVNMPEDAFRRFFTRQVAHVLGGTCASGEPQVNRVLWSWRHNRPHLLTAFGALIPLLTLQYVCANESPLPITLPKAVLYISAVIQVYVTMWIFPLAVSSLYFIPRFGSVPLRYFLGMPAALSMASVGTFYVRFAWVACFGYFFFILQHYVFRTYQTAPLVSATYTGVGICWVILVSIVSQYQIHMLLKHLKARRILEYSYHVEDAFERVMKNPTEKGFEQLRAHQDFMSSLRRLSTRGLTDSDVVQFLLIAAILLGITVAYAYLILHDLWWI
jgi:tetratricopeptide (TPR) repeat protein